MSHMDEILRGALASRKKEKKTLDAADGDTLSGADLYTIKDIELAAVSVILEWAETNDLDEGESYADRLLALAVGIADENKDGDITEDEQAVLDVALNAAWDYLVKIGVTEEDASALLNDWNEDAADRIRELVATSLPDGEDAASAAIDAFIFTDADQEPALDAAYKKVLAIRGGKRVRIRKRISGTVRLSAKQKVAIRKARRKSHSAGARIRRMKSVRIRQKMGL